MTKFPPSKLKMWKSKLLKDQIPKFLHYENKIKEKKQNE